MNSFVGEGERKIEVEEIFGSGNKTLDKTKMEYFGQSRKSFFVGNGPAEFGVDVHAYTDKVNPYRTAYSFKVFVPLKRIYREGQVVELGRGSMLENPGCLREMVNCLVEKSASSAKAIYDFEDKNVEEFRQGAMQAIMDCVNELVGKIAYDSLKAKRTAELNDEVTISRSSLNALLCSYGEQRGLPPEQVENVIKETDSGSGDSYVARLRFLAALSKQRER